MAVLVIGASSAIGQALVNYYLQRSKAVIWLSRSGAPTEHPLLTQLQAPQLQDGQDWQQHQAFFSELLLKLHQQQVDLVFNCVGWLHQAEASGQGQKLMPEKGLSQSSAALMQQTFFLNLQLPVFYLQGLWPYLLKKPAVRYLQLSAKVGSISDNKIGGWYSYRSAKAALNQWIKTASIELQRTNKTAALVTLHPGTTASPLSAPFQRNLPAGQLQTPAQTAEHLAEVAAQLSVSQTGDLLNWDGRPIPF